MASADPAVALAKSALIRAWSALANSDPLMLATEVPLALDKQMACADGPWLTALRTALLKLEVEALSLLFKLIKSGELALIWFYETFFIIII